MSKKTILLDFDGVIHAYKGWKGATHFEDEMVPGAAEAIAEYVEHFEVAIYSTRSSHPKTREALKQWMAERLPKEVMEQLQFVKEKVPATLTIDDRGFHFEGTFPPVPFINDFKPWWQQ